MRYARLLPINSLLVALSLTTACSDDSAPKETSADSEASVAQAGQEEASNQRPTLVDKSLDVEEYIQAGLPAPDRMWTGEDLANCAATLSGLSQEDPSRLPRYKSEQSGEVFARMTNKENLGIFRNRSISVEHRLRDGLKYKESTNKLLGIYLTAFNQGMTGSGELIELAGSGLHIDVEIVQMVKELLPTLDDSAADYAHRIRGIEMAKSGIAMAVSGCLHTLTERDTFRTTELKRLIVYLQETLPHILLFVSEGTRSEFLARLRAFDKNPQMQDLNPELTELVALVESASE